MRTTEPKRAGLRDRIPRWCCTRRGFTLVEIIIGITLFTMIAYYFFSTMIFASRTEQATSKKLLSARALQYIHGRVRRDVKWARRIQVSNQGRSMKLTNHKGEERRYDWDESTGVLKVPGLNSGTQKEYQQTRFRLVNFYRSEHRGEGIRAILSPVPFDDTEEGAAVRHQERARLWGAAMVGRSEAIPYSVAHRYGLFNEPAMADLVQTETLYE